MSTTRFTHGVTNATKHTTLGELGQLDPSKFHAFFDDFDKYAAGDWTITDTGTITHGLIEEDGGVLSVGTDAVADDGSFFQLVKAGFLMAAAKKAFFKARVKVGDATNSVVQVGLILTDTTPLTATDGIFFQKDSGATSLDAYVKKDSTTGQNKIAAIGNMVDATYIDLGFYYDGKGNTDFFIDDVKVASLDSSATYLPDAVLNVSFGVEASTAAAQTLDVDYIFAAKER